MITFLFMLLGFGLGSIITLVLVAKMLDEHFTDNNILKYMSKEDFEEFKRWL